MIRLRTIRDNPSVAQTKSSLLPHRAIAPAAALGYLGSALTRARSRE
jgi:hypothetical protein